MSVVLRGRFPLLTAPSKIIGHTLTVAAATRRDALPATDCATLQLPCKNSTLWQQDGGEGQGEMWEGEEGR